MTPTQFKTLINDVRISLKNDMPIINARSSITALSLIKARIINEGIDHTGKRFGKYSTNPLPFYYFINKSLSKAGEKNAERKLKDNKKQGITGISYEEFREANNLQTSFVDMTFTGETLKDIDVLETKTESNIVVTVIASKNSITKKNGNKTVTTEQVAQYLQERYGEYLNMNKIEEEQVAEIFDNYLQETLNRFL